MDKELQARVVKLMDWRQDVHRQRRECSHEYTFAYIDSEGVAVFEWDYRERFNPLFEHLPRGRVCMNCGTAFRYIPGQLWVNCLDGVDLDWRATINKIYGR